jgi:large subunit ribosomal protein L30
MSAAAGDKMLTVRQIRSGIGYAKNQKATLRALGLGKIGRSRTLPDNQQVRGMLNKIPHLVVIDSDRPGGDRDETS